MLPETSRAPEARRALCLLALLTVREDVEGLAFEPDEGARGRARLTLYRPSVRR